MTVSSALAMAICLLTFGLIIALAVISVAAIVNGDIPPIALPLVIVALLLPIVVRPRFPVIEGEVMTRDQLPDLFGLVDDVAAVIGGPHVDGMIVDSGYNASYGRSGWRRRQIMTIGLPLFWAVEPQTRVALIGHELGHGVNGDPTRGLILGSGIDALLNLHLTLEPDELVPSDQGIVAYLGLPISLALLGLSRLVLGTARLLTTLVMRDQQRAEHYADSLGVRAGGRPAMTSLMEALHAADLVNRMVWIYDRADPIATIGQAVRTMPRGELERIRRVEHLAGSRLDYTHPPTAYRLEIIESLPDAAPAFVFEAERSSRVDAELERFRGPLGREIVEDYEIAVGA